MSGRGRVAGAVATLAAAALAAASAASAAAPSIALSVAPRPQHPAQLRLVSHVGGGAPAKGRTVAFFVVLTVFKQAREVPVGTATTAADGTAHVDYAPTWSGSEQFVAKLVTPGAPATAHVPTATATYRVTVSAPGPLAAGANPPRPLASIGHVFLDVILTAVGLVWLSLVVTLVLAFGWMPRLAGREID